MALRIEHLSKTYPNGIRAVDDVTLTIPVGMFGLLGPNGAGKTTLFKMLATWIIPDAGTATIQGYDIVRQPQQVRGQIASVMANERSLYWRLSAFENLRVHAGLHQMSGTAARKRIREVLEIVELSETGEKMVGTFSTGMRQRLLIARALLGKPQVLLLDEPTRSLDPISAKSFRGFLRKEIALRQGCAVLLATHSSEEAMDLCDRVGVLHRGTLLAIGTTDELKRRFGDERYLIWTATPTHQAFQQIVQDGLASEVESLPGNDGWIPVRLVIRGGRERAARVLDRLTGSSVSIAGFERIDLSLGDLIERIVNGRTP